MPLEVVIRKYWLVDDITYITDVRADVREGPVSGWVWEEGVVLSWGDFWLREIWLMDD